MTVGFKRIKWFTSRSAYQDMQYFRQRRAAASLPFSSARTGCGWLPSTARHTSITSVSYGACSV